MSGGQIWCAPRPNAIFKIANQRHLIANQRHFAANQRHFAANQRHLNTRHCLSLSFHCACFDPTDPPRTHRESFLFPFPGWARTFALRATRRCRCIRYQRHTNINGTMPPTNANMPPTNAILPTNQRHFTVNRRHAANQRKHTANEAAVTPPQLHSTSAFPGLPSPFLLHALPILSNESRPQL